MSSQCLAAKRRVRSGLDRLKDDAPDYGDVLDCGDDPQSDDDLGGGDVLGCDDALASGDDPQSDDAGGDVRSVWSSVFCWLIFCTGDGWAAGSLLPSVSTPCVAACRLLLISRSLGRSSLFSHERCRLLLLALPGQ